MRLAAVLGLALAGCAPASGPAARLTLADIQPILKPLVVRDVLNQTCGAADTSARTAFLADLKAAGASAGLLEQATVEADRIAALDMGAPKESLCTAEFFESTDTMAMAARMAWAELKTRKP